MGLQGCRTQEGDDDATGNDDDTGDDDTISEDDDTTPGDDDTSACTVFPEDNPWNTDISGYPVHERSAAWVASTFQAGTLFPGFGTEWKGEPIGIPYNEVNDETPLHSVAFMYGSESDPGPYPIPDDALIEGSYESDGDRHILMVNWGACFLYELYWTWPPGEGPNHSDTDWYAGSGAIFDLRSNDLRPDYWTSADAAGLPIYPGLLHYREVIEEGEIGHAVRFTVPQTQRAFIHPATHYASDDTDPNLPPMGTRLRLKKDYDLSGYSPETVAILTALKKYGMLLADNGGDNVFITGVPDPRWNEDNIHEMTDVPPSAFEAVDTGPVIYEE